MNYIDFMNMTPELTLIIGLLVVFFFDLFGRRDGEGRRGLWMLTSFMLMSTITKCLIHNEPTSAFGGIYVTSDATVEESNSKKVTVTGRILLQQWVKDGTVYVIKNEVDEKRWKITCDVKTWKDNGDTYENYTKTGIQTNAEGVYSFSINLPDNWKNMANNPQIKISTEPELDKNFTGRYYDIDKTTWKSQTCTVTRLRGVLDLSLLRSGGNGDQSQGRQNQILKLFHNQCLSDNKTIAINNSKCN